MPDIHVNLILGSYSSLLFFKSRIKYKTNCTNVLLWQQWLHGNVMRKFLILSSSLTGMIRTENDVAKILRPTNVGVFAIIDCDI